jgi:hypothetical protein
VRHRILIFVVKILWRTDHTPQNMHLGASQMSLFLLLSLRLRIYCMDFEAGEEARTLSMDFEGWRSSKGEIMVDFDLGSDSVAPINGGGRGILHEWWQNLSRRIRCNTRSRGISMDGPTEHILHFGHREGDSTEMANFSVPSGLRHMML